jgi:hypothetical protein
MKLSRFRDGLPHIFEWCVGSMKSGPTLKGWTLYFLQSTDMSPVAIVVLPVPLPVPAIRIADFLVIVSHSRKKSN